MMQRLNLQKFLNTPCKPYRPPVLFLFTVVFDGIFDCSDLAQHAITSSGVYTLLSDGASHPLNAKFAYCDMETDGGG